MELFIIFCIVVIVVTKKVVRVLQADVIAFASLQKTGG
jgi:hypothetical protein